MKKITQAPHDEIKAYLKVAKERLAQAFFVRPEWRKPKSVGALNVIISRINEVYYPFSDRKKPKSAVWKQVLREKREEMIEEIEAAKETQENKNKIKASGVVKEPVRLIEPGLNGLPAAAPPAKEWTKERIEQLRIKIKAHRGRAAKIARSLGITQVTLCCILKARGYSKKGLDEWLPKIKTAFDALMKPGLDAKCDTSEAEKSIKEVKALFDEDEQAARESLRGIADGGESVMKKPDPNADRSLVDFPVRGNSLISYMDVGIKDGKLHVHVVVDADAAFGLYKERQLSVSKDQIKFSMA